MTRRVGMKNDRDGRRCERVMTRYLMLDRGVKLPLAVRRHLMYCAKCRKTIASLKLAERVAASELAVPVPVTDEAVNAVLARAGVARPQKMWPGPMTMPSWIIVGVLMLVSMAVFVLETGGSSSSLQDLAVGLVFALVVTLYCVAFVTGNIDYFVKKTGVGLAAA